MRNYARKGDDDDNLQMNEKKRKITKDSVKCENETKEEEEEEEEEASSAKQSPKEQRGEKINRKSHLLINGFICKRPTSATVKHSI